MPERKPESLERNLRPPHPWWQGPWAFALCLLVFLFVAYLPVWHAGFLWDDGSYLVGDTSGHWDDFLWRVWKGRFSNDYVPMVETSFWAERQLWGPYPLGYHLDNLLLHGISALLIWQILTRLKIPGGRLAALIFALHPVNVESVAWISERKNTLAMALFLDSIWCYLQFDDSGRRAWYRCALIAFALALLSKTAAAPLPFVLVGIVWWRRQAVSRVDMIRILPFFIVGVTGAFLGMAIQRGMKGSFVLAASPSVRLARAGWAFWFYLAKAFYPVHLIPVYPRWHIDTTQWVSFLPSIGAAAALLGVWLFRRKLGRAPLASLGYYTLLIAPVLGFVDIGPMFWQVADHWQYFAMIGPIALLSAFLTRLPAQSRNAVAVAIVAALGILSFRHCLAFETPAALWKATLAADPDSFIGHSGMGGLLVNRGQTDAAIAEFRKSVAIEPAYWDARYILGTLYLRTGQVADAVAQYQAVLRLVPDHPLACNNLAWIRATCPDARFRDGPQAVELAERANNLLHGSQPSTWGTLAAAYAEAGRFPQALNAAHRGLDLASIKGDAQDLKTIRNEISYYEGRQPYRDRSLTPADGSPQ